MTNSTIVPSDRTHDDPLHAAIRSVFHAASKDFGPRFTRQFDRVANPDGMSENAWCWRLKHRVAGLEPSAVIDGYELAVRTCAPHCPVLMDIANAAKAKALEAKRIAEDLARANMPRIPAGSGLAGLVEHFAAEAEGDIATGCLAMMREILARPPAATAAERFARLDKAVAAHDTLLAMTPIIPRVYGERRECGLTGCDKPGTMSHDTKGAGPWYCAEHFLR